MYFKEWVNRDYEEEGKPCCFIEICMDRIYESGFDTNEVKIKTKETLEDLIETLSVLIKNIEEEISD